MLLTNPMRRALGSIFFALLLPIAVAAATTKAPNVIVMLIDDLGQTDVGCYGSKYHETPHIDKLAADGMRFTQASSACTVCSPTRAALLTGKYPARLRITDWIAGHGRPKAKLLPPENWNLKLPLEEQSLAELFKTKSYATVLIGKWHLGGPEFFPEKQGFDQNIGGTHRGEPPSYFSPYGIPTLTDGPKGEFLTDREAAEACKFIEANQEKPFFIYLPHHAVHTPIMGKKDVIEKYTAKAAQHPSDPQRNAKYAALVESVDDSVGTIRAKLEELKLWDNTVIIFTSDNGGMSLWKVTANLGLRAGKGSAYEGGTRVPFIIRWPGKTQPGSLCHVPIITPDILPTLASGCGLPLPKDVDGVNLLPLIEGKGKLDRDAIFWHYPHYHPGGATPYSAIRKGDHKLIHFFEDHLDELYNLKADPEEKTNLAATQPELARQLRQELEVWWKHTSAQMPRQNPNYNPKAPGPK